MRDKEVPKGCIVVVVENNDYQTFDEGTKVCRHDQRRGRLLHNGNSMHVWIDTRDEEGPVIENLIVTNIGGHAVVQLAESFDAVENLIAV